MATTLVLGGTGKVGTAVVRELVAAGATVRVMTRRPEQARLPPGVEAMPGDLAEAATLDRAFAGVHRVAFVPPLDRDEERLDLAAVEAAERAGVERFVLLSVHGLESLPSAVHLDAKRVAERELARRRLPAVVVRPASFFQNDLLVWPLLEQGLYAMPHGEKPFYPVDTRDVGEAMARLLLGDDRRGETVPLVGPEPWTGSAITALWSRVLGREVRHVGADLDAWEAAARAHRPDWLVDALAAMYRAMRERGAPASPAEIAAGAELVGHPLRRYEDFARQLAAGEPVL